MAFNNRILVIDDDPAILDIFTAVLSPSSQARSQESLELSALLGVPSGSKDTGRKREFQVDTALQGEEGFEKVKAALDRGEPYAVVFTDMRMPPGWDGVRTAKEIRALDPMIEIIVVTAFSDASIAEIVKQVGFTDRLLYLKKPFDDEEILQLADSLCMRWNLEHKVRGMIRLLEEMIDSFFMLREAAYQEEELQPFLMRTLKQIGLFLETPDVFLARVENQEIKLKIGIGRFANGLSNDPAFLKLIQEVIDSEPYTKILQIDQYIVLPVSCHRWQSVVVGLISEFEIEGIHQLLEVLAKDMAKVFETVARISALRSEVISKDQQIADLTEQLRKLKAKTL